MAGNVHVLTATGKDATGQAFDSINRNIEKTSRNAKKLNGSLRIMRGGMGQLGHQIQDVAVQLQMGQNPLMVLTQQGSQVASLFGPTGAVIGAVGAVAGALAAAFIPKLMESEEKLDQFRMTMESVSSIMSTEFTNSTIKLTNKFVELAAISESLARVSLQRGMIETETALIAVNEELSGSTATLFALFDRGSTAFKNNSAMARAVHQRYGILLPLANELVNATKALETGQEGAAERFAEMAETVLAETTAVGKNRQELLDFLKPLELNIEQTARLEKAQKDLNHIFENFPSILEANRNGLKDTADADQAFVDRMVAAGAKFQKSRSEQMQIDLDARRANLDAGQIAEAEAAIQRVRTVEQEIERQKQLRKDQVEAERRISAELAAARVIEQGQAANVREFVGKTRKLEAMRQSFMGEMELLATQEQEKRDFILGLEDKFFTEQFTRQDALTQMEQHFADKRTEIALKEAEDKKRAQQMAMNVIEQSLGFMASNLKEGTALQKAAFLATRAFAASEAIIAAERAAALVLPNIPLSQFVRTMGYTNAAMIMAQAVSSFDGGGFTGRGSRSGGLDGKGGFMAMLHPNETVVDHTKGGAGVTIVNNIDATGGGPDVDIKIRRAVELGNQQTVHVIRDLAARGRLV